MNVVSHAWRTRMTLLPFHASTASLAWTPGHQAPHTLEYGSKAAGQIQMVQRDVPSSGDQDCKINERGTNRGEQSQQRGAGCLMQAALQGEPKPFTFAVDAFASVVGAAMAAGTIHTASAPAAQSRPKQQQQHPHHQRGRGTALRPSGAGARGGAARKAGIAHGRGRDADWGEREPMDVDRRSLSRASTAAGASEDGRALVALAMSHVEHEYSVPAWRNCLCFQADFKECCSWCLFLHAGIRLRPLCCWASWPNQALYHTSRHA